MSSVLTASPAPRSATTFHHMASGQTLQLSLPAGAELFCASGQLLLQTSPLSGLDAAPGGLQQRLQPGQSWRAPQPLQLQVSATQGPARWRCQAPLLAPPAPALPCSGWRSVLQRLGMLEPRPVQPR